MAPKLTGSTLNYAIDGPTKLAVKYIASWKIQWAGANSRPKHLMDLRSRSGVLLSLVFQTAGVIEVFARELAIDAF